MTVLKIPKTLEDAKRPAEEVMENFSEAEKSFQKLKELGMKVD